MDQAVVADPGCELGDAPPARVETLGVIQVRRNFHPCRDLHAGGQEWPCSRAPAYFIGPGDLSVRRIQPRRQPFAWDRFVNWERALCHELTVGEVPSSSSLRANTVVGTARPCRLADTTRPVSAFA